MTRPSLTRIIIAIVLCVACAGCFTQHNKEMDAAIAERGRLIEERWEIIADNHAILNYRPTKGANGKWGEEDFLFPGDAGYDEAVKAWKESNSTESEVRE